MKKIGLISYHFWYNFGTTLQAYALHKIIKDLGYDSEYIDYKWKWVNPSISNKTITTTIKSLFYFPFRNWKKNENINLLLGHNEFDNFAKKYIPVSKLSYTTYDLMTNPPTYEKYIVGSDQTWSPNILEEEEMKAFFLSFVEDNNKKNAYAPSIGTTVIKENLIPFYRNELIKFNKISCREKTGCEILTQILNKKIDHVLDPTLLLTAEQWKEIQTPYNITGPYILCYILGTKSCISKYAEKLGRTKNLPVYYIVTSPFYIQKRNKLIAVGPSQFIDLINNATYVITDSFHGTLFSINFEKNFYSFMKRIGDYNSHDNSRILDVLSEYSLENRFKKDEDLSFEKDIDYSNVSNTLNIKRAKSLNYLDSILK